MGSIDYSQCSHRMYIFGFVREDKRFFEWEVGRMIIFRISSAWMIKTFWNIHDFINRLNMINIKLILFFKKIRNGKK